MKKFYIAATALFLGGVSVAQSNLSGINLQPLPLKVATSINESNTTVNQTKALGTAVWSDDFTTAANWTIDNGSATAPFGWNIGTTVNSWAFTSAINSTSGGNFAELYNGDPTSSDPLDAPLSQTFTMTTTSSIDVNTLSSGNNQVKIEFDQYGALFQDNQEVYVSTDGTNFTLVGDNSDIDPLTSSGGSAYANPMHRSFDISAAIAGNPSTVWVRFSWSPGVQAITYGWMIDDVAIVTKPDWDLEFRDSDWGSVGLHYFQIPLTQATGIDFWAKASNEGAQDLTNVTYNVDITAGSFNGTSNSVTITPTNLDSLGLTAQFTPTANGTYTATRSFTMTEVDDIPSNNTLSDIVFDVNDNIYARDMGTIAGSAGGEDGNSPGDFAFEAGNLFDVFADDEVWAVNVTVGDNTPDQTIIYGAVYVYDANAGNFVLVNNGITNEYTVTTADVTNNSEIVLTFPGQTSASVTAGNTYLVVVGTYSEFYYGTSGSSDTQTSFIMYPTVGGTGGQYYTTSTPMVRMNFDQTLGLEEAEANNFSLGQNFPNPTNGSTQVNYELYTTAEVTFQVTDINGKVISSKNLGTQPAGSNVYSIDASKLANGLYYYTMIVDGNKATRKFTVQK